MIIRSAPIAALVLALAAPALFACKSNSGKTPTPSTTAASTPAPVETSTAAPTGGDIRSLDLEHTAPVQREIAATGGEYVQTSVIYDDLTGDGVDEAVVPIASGGTLGDLAYIVLSSGASGVIQLLASAPDPESGGGLAVAVVNGKLVETRPIYGPTDPNCCPSQLRTTVYAWDGSKLSQESTSTAPNPAGGVKSTPVAGAPR